MKRLLLVVAVIACLIPVGLRAQLTYFYSLDIGSDLEMSDPVTPGPIDPGDIELLSLITKDDSIIFSIDPPPPGPVPVGFSYEQGIETNYFDLDGEDQLEGFIDLADQGAVQTQAVGGLILNPDEIIFSVDDDQAPGWYSQFPVYPTGDVPVNSTPDHGSDTQEVMSAKGWYSWGPNPGAPLLMETNLALSPDPAPQANDDDVDALDLEKHRYWYWSSDHEATYGTDPGDIYGTDTMGVGATWNAIDNTIIGIANGADIDAFEFIVTDDPTILANFGLGAGKYLALLFSVDQNDPITTADESGGLTSSAIYISLFTGAPPMLLNNREDGDVDALTVYKEGEPEGKWVQWPDLSINGVDVNATLDVLSQTQTNLLADDFACTNMGQITNITVWGSWRFDEYPEGNVSNVSFTLSMHSDVPTNEMQAWSMPGKVLWYQMFDPGMFEVTRYNQNPIQEGWMDPPDQYFFPGDTNCWQYTFPVTNNPFVQTGTVANPVIYWLDVQAIPYGMGTEAFGWKTSTNHWNDDATWVHAEEPYEGPWNELRYPPGHELGGQSMDLAFRIETGDALDYGDAPDTYGTLLASGGARHVLGGPWLGNSTNNPDFDVDGQPHPGALGDDYDGNDDERGVWIATGKELITGLTTNFNVIVSGGGGVFQIWIDWNLNGAFDLSENVTNITLADGSHYLPITTPTNATPGSSFARCRISSAGGLGATGPALDGEVEDHSLTVDNGYVDWGNLQHPPATTTTVGQASDTIYGQVWESGVTEGAGQGPWITAELGYGPDGSTPDGNPSWTWVSTTYNPGQTNNNDEYTATLTIMSTGVYDYAYRYTRNWLEWTYGDRDGNAYTPTNAGHMVVVSALNNYDYGDAPSPYPTLLTDSGARHLIGGILLGSNVDGEADGQPSVGSDGDDSAGIDDEDGVVFLSNAVRGDTVTVAVITWTTGGVLNTWIDFNADGDWVDAGEKVISDVPIPTMGTNLALIPVPSDAAVGPIYSRFRYASAAGLSYTGTAADGEVEDYTFTVYQGALSTNIVITNIENVVTASTATVWWQAESNVVYQMQLVTNLSTNTPSEWTNVGAQVIGPADEQSDTNATTDKRFYRVVAPYVAP